MMNDTVYQRKMLADAAILLQKSEELGANEKRNAYYAAAARLVETAMDELIDRMKEPGRG